ncbi:hypothetical protein [Paraglaciecola sp. 2405UD69-4]|uniref:hypothetical protein n=1 Tax=Paraglaciecola sp. 2405UD69-4 TaxID=3391836 RepID=UPI0039C8C571
MQPEETTKLNGEVSPSDDAEIICKWRLFKKIDESGSNIDRRNFEPITETLSGSTITFENIDKDKSYRLDLRVKGKGGTEFTRKLTSNSHKVVPNGEKKHKISGSSAVVGANAVLWRIKPKND